MSHCQVVEFHSGAPPGWPVEFGNPPKVSAGRGTGAFAVPRGRAQLGHLLQVAIQYGGMDVSMMARVKELEEEKPAPEEDVRRVADGFGDPEGSPSQKNGEAISAARD